MLEVGLTGGIGSGKSTVASLLVKLGAVVLDADVIVRQLQEPGKPVFVAMVERWGESIVGSSGALDRQAVADRVFGDEEELAALNSIVHPAVGDEMARRREELSGTDVTVVLDIPLLIEAGYHDLAGIIVVDVDPEVAVKRLTEYRSFTEKDARDRISRQASRADRLAQADVIIDNSGSLADLAAEVDRAWMWIESLARPPLDREITRIRSRAESLED